MPAFEKRKLIGQILKEQRKVKEGQIQEALTEQRRAGGQFGRILVAKGFVTEADLSEALAAQAGLAVVSLRGRTIPADVIARIDAQTATAFRVVPYAFAEGTLRVALADPMNASVLDDIRFMASVPVEGAVAPDVEIDEAIRRYYGAREESMDTILDAIEKESKGLGSSIDDAEALAKSAPIVKLLNYILFTAIRDKSSDIHFEPFEEEFKLRYRVDGVLFELRSPPRHLAVALISRIKVLANLDIAETRIPQDGRIDLMVGGRPVDIRVSTLPTMFGESCVLRVLDRSVVSLDLTNIGLRESEIALVKRFAELPHGIVLVTGPTGSGKTTTLYSLLNHANSDALKIITTEDPVEYDLDGIIQVQVNEEIGVGYATCLRSILRQDPDMILVGEIRDAETARIAVEASLTGHVVFSTLHTNDAPSAITRLLDIGVASYLIAATLEAVVAQRLVRRVCTACRTWYEPPDEVLRELEIRPADLGGRKFAAGRGCETCHGTGYRGRMALFEIMVVTDPLREAIVGDVTTSRLRALALEQGMQSLRQSGLMGIFDGLTTPEEVIRETVGSL